MEELENKKIYLCGTPYHILISLLISNLEEKNIFYVSSKSKLIINNMRKLFKEREEIQKLGFGQIILRKRTTLKEILFLERLIDKYHYKKYNFDNIVNFGWHKDCYYFYSNFFCKHSKKVTLVEDGITMYRHSMPLKSLNIKKKIFGLIIEPWNQKNVEKILVQKPNKFPIEYSSKIEKLDLIQLFKSITEEKKEILIKIFFKKEIKLNKKEKNILILTQPLSEDKVIGKKFKIELYNKLVVLNKEKNIIFKPHPRDTENYKDIFKNNKIIYIDRDIPIEVVNLLNLRIDEVISVCSSGTHNLFNIEKAIEIYPELMSTLVEDSKLEREKKIRERLKI